MSKQWYTVVGVFPDGGASIEAFVEWVRAETPDVAIAEASIIDPAREEATPICVFKGRHTDVLVHDDP